MESADPDPIDAAVRAGDLDELLRLVDRSCDAHDWDALARLRERCRRAHETGRQLWPAAAHASYRLALDAPAPFAAAVLEEGEGRFALGPLPEVAAQRHTWEELAPHVPAGAPAVVAAHERAVRGEDCTSRIPSGPPVLELPLRLSAWEPRYAVAEYAPERAEFPTPPLPALAPVELPTAPERETPDDAVRALFDVVRTWTSQSNGHVDAVTVRSGGVLDAIATLGCTAVRGAPVDTSTALAWLAWAGASGGARGRRPGAAAGRFAAWWAVAAMVGMTEDWPPDDQLLGRELARLRWLVWDDQARGKGWRLHLASEDTSRGRAWAVTATDSA